MAGDCDCVVYGVCLVYRKEGEGMMGYAKFITVISRGVTLLSFCSVVALIDFLDVEETVLGPFLLIVGLFWSAYMGVIVFEKLGGTKMEGE